MTRPKGRRLLAIAAAAVLPLSLATPASAAPDVTSTGYGHHASKRVVGYFTQWGIYGRNFRLQNVDASGQAAGLTHLNYAFGNVSKDGTCFIVNEPGQGDAWADFQTPFSAEQSVDGVADAGPETQPLAGNFNQIRELKAKHPKLKALISLGGWTWSNYFSDAALTPASRKKFVSSCIDLYIKGNLPLLDGARRPRLGRRRFRRHRPRLGVARCRGRAGQRRPPGGQAELHQAGRGVPPPARRVRAHAAQALRADRVPPRRPQDRERRHRDPQDLQVLRLRDGPGLRLQRHLGPEHQPPGPAVLAARRPEPGPLQR